MRIRKYLLLACAALPMLLAGCQGAATPTPTPRPLPAVGGRIAFLSDRSGKTELWLVDSTGQNPHVLLPGQQMDIPPVWSPDGTALAYGANQGGKTALGVLRVNPDGSPGTNTVLTHEPDDGDNLGPAWSPDGKTLAFQSNRGSGAYQVYTIPAEGGTPSPVAGQPAVANFPAWSPDGKTLVFAGGSDRAKRDLWVAPLGGKAAQISNTGTDVSLPRWQRDGKTILFLLRTQGSATHNLATIAPDGTGQRNLTTGEYEDLGPAISPDGAWIAFFSNRPTSSGGNASGRNNEVYVMPRDASSVTNVTETAAGDVDPSWAPDSQHLVFASGREGAYRLYVTNRDGATVAPLTGGDGDYNDTFPTWSPAK